VPAGNTIIITANPTDLVSTVKELIKAQKPELIPAQYFLFLDDLKLIDTSNLIEQGVLKDVTLKVEMKQM
jgi:hypothetical protein